jgi:predicted peptidase
MRKLLPLALLVAVGCGRSDPAAANKPTVPEAAALPDKKGPGMLQLQAQVPGGGQLRYALSVPSGYDGQSPVPLVVALHYGYDGNTPKPYIGRGMIEAFEPGLSVLGAIVAAPDALGGDWTDAKNEQAVVWLTRSLMKTYPIDPKRVAVTGFSLGGEGAWFVGGRHQDLFTGAVPVAGRPAGGSLDWTIPVYVIHSERDEIIPIGPARQHAEALKAKGARVEFKAVPDLTHYETPRYAPHVRDAVVWLRGQWK